MRFISKHIGKCLLALAVLIVVAGYGVGSYFVDYALKRGNESDPMALPPACEKIHSKGIVIPDPPRAPSEVWEARSTDGRRLVATHYEPGSPGHDWAILIHGYGRDRRYTGEYAEAYLEHGYQAVAPDLCASGESEGEYITMGVRESEEIALWAREIAARDPDARIVLHGVSMGAATALMAAAREDAPCIFAVVEDCGYTSAYEMFSEQLGVIFGLPSFPIMDCVDIVSGLKTGVKVSDAAPIHIMDRIHAPVLFIHGDADKLVPLSMMEELYNACPGEKEKLVVHGAAHAASMGHDRETYWGTVFDFLETK